MIYSALIRFRLLASFCPYCWLLSFSLLWGLAVLLPHGAVVCFANSEEKDDILLLEFTSTGCGACQQIKPLLDEMRRQGYPIKTVSLDERKNRAVFNQYGVQSMPTLIMLLDGREVERIVGQGEGMRELQPQLLTLFNETIAMKKSRMTQSSTGLVNSAIVRLQVATGNATDSGTGTIIHVNRLPQGLEALVLTCGHLFRENKGIGPLQVDLFHPQTGEAVRVQGECIRYDNEIDLAFVGIPLPFDVQPIPIVSFEYLPRPGDKVISIGCSGGRAPTILEHQILSTDRSFFQPKPESSKSSFHYIQVSTAPVVGRSGGGLFVQNEKGLHLLGVCNAGDPQTNDGFFVPASIVYQEILTTSSLSFVYNDLIRQQSSPVPIATPTTGISAVSAMMTDHSSGQTRSANFEGALSQENPLDASLAELRRRQQQGAEIICIVNWNQTTSNDGKVRETEIIRLPGNN